MWTPDIYTQLIDLEVTDCDETVRENADGSYTMLLNARQATNRLRDAFIHASEHIFMGDFDEEYLDVDRIEAIRHEGSTM